MSIASAALQFIQFKTADSTSVTAEYVADELFTVVNQDSMKTVRALLRDMRKAGKIKARVINGNVYYRAV